MKRAAILTVPIVAIGAMLVFLGVLADSILFEDGAPALWSTVAVLLSVPLTLSYIGSVVPRIRRRLEAELVERARRDVQEFERAHGSLTMPLIATPKPREFVRLDREERLPYWKRWLVENGEYVPDDAKLLRPSGGQEDGNRLVRPVTDVSQADPALLLRVAAQREEPPDSSVARTPSE